MQGQVWQQQRGRELGNENWNHKESLDGVDLVVDEGIGAVLEARVGEGDEKGLIGVEGGGEVVGDVAGPINR